MAVATRKRPRRSSRPRACGIPVDYVPSGAAHVRLFRMMHRVFVVRGVVAIVLLGGLLIWLFASGQLG